MSGCIIGARPQAATSYAASRPLARPGQGAHLAHMRFRYLVKLAAQLLTALVRDPRGSIIARTKLAGLNPARLIRRILVPVPSIPPICSCSVDETSILNMSWYGMPFTRYVLTGVMMRFDAE